MLDPESVRKTLETGLIVWGSKDMLGRLLGPTADYLGDKTKGLVKKCDVNLNSIFVKAVKRLGKKMDEPGSVSPRVLKQILEEGRFCEDELAAEYFGGILACSRSEDGRDDRGLTYLAMVKDLSVYQIRSHYLFYHLVKALFSGKGLTLGLESQRREMKVFFEGSAFLEALSLNERELNSFQSIVSHVMIGLEKESLIDHLFYMGSSDSLKNFFPQVECDGVIFSPSIMGVDLFLWAHGRSDVLPNEFLDTAVTFEIDKAISVPIGKAKSVGKRG